MIPRKSGQRDDIAFGSDSFMDILANIVGILIILIVVVGVRVKNAPARAAALLQESINHDRLVAWEIERDRIEAENARRRRLREGQLAERAEELARRDNLLSQMRHQQAQADERLAERESEIQRRRRLLAQYEQAAADLRREVDRLQGLLAAETARTAKQKARRGQRESLNSTIAEREEQLRRLQQELSQQQSATRELAALEESVRQRVTHLHRQIETLHSKTPPTKQRVHHASPLVQKQQAVLQQRNMPQPGTSQWGRSATPLAETVHRDEALFRCLNNRIADTRYEKLIEKARRHVALALRQRGMAPAVDRRGMASVGPATQLVIQKIVGPEHGFRLAFECTASAYRQRLEEWQLVGESDDLGETLQEALEPSSSFRSSLVGRPPDNYVMTIFVYPDSFGLATAVQSYLHELGYTVALRPLPADHPIAGSPWGSASRGQ